MKTILGYLSGILFICSFSNCANGKKIAEKAPTDLQQAYYTTWTGGVEGAGSGLKIFIPLIETENSGVELDSVYFRGKRAKLQIKPKNKNLYIGYFKMPDNTTKAPDIIMSSDPREEYGNRPPEIIKDFPFDLERDEAVISFRKNGKTGYYRLNVVEKKDTKIKYPENIQH